MSSPTDPRAGVAVGGRDGAILNVVLYQPQIPQNTGNIARTCAAVGAALHLVEPLGFAVTDSAVRRAGLDYWSEVSVHRHGHLEPVLAAAGAAGGQLVLLSTHGTRPYTRFRYRHGCYLLFGNETTGLPADAARPPPVRHRPHPDARRPALTQPRQLGRGSGLRGPPPTRPAGPVLNAGLSGA